MKNYIVRNEIYPGEYTEKGGNLFVAVKKTKNTSCLDQCDCKSLSCRFCTGFCFRWDHNSGVVFKRVDKEPEGDYTVVMTQL